MLAAKSADTNLLDLEFCWRMGRGGGGSGEVRIAETQTGEKPIG